MLIHLQGTPGQRKDSLGSEGFPGLGSGSWQARVAQSCYSFFEEAGPVSRARVEQERATIGCAPVLPAYNQPGSGSARKKPIPDIPVLPRAREERNPAKVTILDLLATLRVTPEHSHLESHLAQLPDPREGDEGGRRAWLRPSCRIARSQNTSSQNGLLPDSVRK